MVGEPLAPFGWDTLCVPGFVVVDPVPSGVVESGASDSLVPGELGEPLDEPSPGDAGEPVVGVESDVGVVVPLAPDSAPEAAPADPDPVGEPVDESALPVAPLPPDGDVPVDDPELSVCDVVPDDESPEPVVSAKDTAGVVAIAVPTPSATASAPTRPT